MANLQTLSVSEVLAIHECLVRDFAAAADPIGHGGVKSMGLLESAVVSRQHTGFQGTLKFRTPIANAATLGYGICQNHPFHNGNKRTSLVAMMCHLDKNGLTFDESISQDALYDFMLNVARHVYSRPERNGEPDADHEVAAMAAWMERRVRRLDTRDVLVRYRELKKILVRHGFALEEPSGNSIEIVKYETSRGFLGIGKKTVRRRVWRMGNPGDGREVSRGELKQIRKACNLTEADGVDTQAFHAGSRPADYFIGRYRGALRRLART